MRVLRWSGVLVAVLALTQATFAAGMLIPKDRDVPPLAIKSHRVSVTISDQVAVTKVEQVFENSTPRDLEATYIFPVPKGASITEFALYIKGQRVPGELLPREKAREIYTDIVRRMRDPALLEYMDSQLFQVKVYPVPANGRQKLELQFTQLLPRDGELARYEYPLKTTGEAARTLEDFSVAVDLTAKEALTNIYSPTHSVGVTRKDDHHAVVGFEQDRALLDRDFLLYYAVSEKDLGLNLITYRPDPQKPGYFMMLISPREELAEEKVLPRDMTFVFDTSGSMQGEKIQQARAALRYCVQGLKPQDRFNIVAFSTTTDPFQDGLVEASGENVKAALAYIDKLEARGGTDINSALTQALSAKGSAAKGAEERPATILFMTDGRPTVGVTEAEEILKNVRQANRTTVGVTEPEEVLRKFRQASRPTVGVTEPEELLKSARGANKAETRIFVFGVGDDVNTHLLDKVSGENKGLSDYVRPSEDIEVKVSSLFNKIRKPVLADVTLSVDKVTIRDCYPTELGDLFAGTELTLLGRYDKPGDALIRLTGTARAEKKSFDYEGTFAEKDVEHQFVAHLWATRKIGYLLDQVRLHGESKELRDEVVALSTEFGIPTPYTSYLALPEAERGRYLPTTVLRSRGVEGRAPVEALAAPAAPSSSFNEARRQREAAPMAAPLGRGRAGAAGGGGGGGGGDLRMYNRLGPETGAEAVEAAKSIADLKRAERPTGLAVKKVGERTFEYWSGFWVDRAYKTDMPTVEVKYLSDAYFKVLAAAPELKDVFALGDRVVVVLKGKALVIQAEGKEDMSDKDVADLLGR